MASKIIKPTKPSKPSKPTTQCTQHTQPTNQHPNPFQVIASRVHCSYSPCDSNYVSRDEYILLLDIVPFLTDENIAKYIIGVCVNKTPFSRRDVNHYMTRVITDPKYYHLSRYYYNDMEIDVMAYYKEALIVYRRDNYDVFNRGNTIHIKYKNQWIPTTVRQLAFFSWMNDIGLYEYISKHIGTIKKHIKEEEKDTSVLNSTHPTNEENIIPYHKSRLCIEQDYDFYLG